ncbi:MAG: TolB family protein, partial [Candidatus Cryptobacteroides sp.]
MTNLTRIISPVFPVSLRRLLFAVLLSLAPVLCRAQFYQAGDNPASLKWYSTSTEHFRIVYPAGMDSTAREYGRTLEKYRTAVGATAGYIPGELTHGKIPVILHAYTARSNGSVAWAPKRMDLYTSPDAYASDFIPWQKSLVIHESRHVAQMQTGLSGIFRPFNYIFGEMFNGLVIGLYPPEEMLEGDAVIAETALTCGGRGRTADFLNYYMIAFDQGDFRNWNKWRFGSQKNYTPSYYAAGYLMFGGIRFLYGVDDFVGRHFHHISKRPYDILGFETTLRHTAGRPIRKAFVEIADTLNRIWRKDIEARKPFIGTVPMTPEPRFYTRYSATCAVGQEFWTVKNSLTRPSALVRTDLSGKEKYVRAFSSEVKKLSWDATSGRIYWSEPVSDIRWSQKVNSRIRFYDTAKSRAYDLTKDGRLFHPAVSPDGKTVCAVEYTDDTRTGLVFLEAPTGRKVLTVMAPDSLQLVECAFLDGETVAASAVSDDGFGIYIYNNGIWDTVLEPVRAIVRNLKVSCGSLAFSCDRTGVMELYSLDPASGKVLALTSNRYGADDFAFSPSGDTLVFSAKTYRGNLLVKTPSDSLSDREVPDFREVHKYAIAEELTRQETGR